MTLAADLVETHSNAQASVDSFEHEQRFLLTEDQAAVFLARVAPSTTLDPWDPARPVSYARTTYFDDDSLSYFRSGNGAENASPVMKRVRVREYALAARLDEIPIFTDLCFLELKQESRQTRRKLRLQASRRLIQALVNGRGTLPPTEDEPLLAGGSLFALDAIRRELNHQRLSARISTWYRRVCLRHPDGDVRITLDEELLFLWPGPLGTGGAPASPTERLIAKGPPRILEIKLKEEAPRWLQAAMAHLPAPSEFSKYQWGMQALADSLPIASTLAASARDDGAASAARAADPSA